MQSIALQKLLESVSSDEESSDDENEKQPLCLGPPPLTRMPTQIPYMTTTEIRQLEAEHANVDACVEASAHRNMDIHLNLVISSNAARSTQQGQRANRHKSSARGSGMPVPRYLG